MSRTMIVAMILLLLACGAQAQTSSDVRVLMHRSEAPAGLAIRAERTPTVTVPAETEAEIQLLSGLHTRVTGVDEPVRAQLVRPVFVRGRVALPSGTLLDGRVTKIRSATRLHRPGELALRFEQITLPDGQIEPVSAVLAGLDKGPTPQVRLDSEGYLRGTRGLTWKNIAGSMLAVGAIGAVKLGFAGAGAFAGPWLPATGSALLAYEVFWMRGNEVHVPPDTCARIRLDYPLTVRVSW